MHGISANNFFQAIMKSVPKVFLQLWLACNMCHCFDYMLFVMVYIVYDYVFVGGAVAFDRFGQLFEFSEFAVCMGYFSLMSADVSISY